ncbi:unnamed protein product [Polarella glacialis]|uniref:Uncharacterized protein n=1 Tax=Polarella glacialis TaxID=89957 RepID=A0A813GFP0_POLGL|nr:unnamed protein product [Polarella glacialis]CAE8690537.1 unnamed protein product [Polarella glacialis]
MPSKLSRDTFALFLSWVEDFGNEPDRSRKISAYTGRWEPLGIRDARAVLWVEDPTLPTNNCAACLLPNGWKATLEEIRRALALLGSNAPLASVCSDDAPSRIELAPPRLRAELQAKRQQLEFQKRRREMAEEEPEERRVKSRRLA